MYCILLRYCNLKETAKKSKRRFLPGALKNLSNQAKSKKATQDISTMRILRFVAACSLAWIANADAFKPLASPVTAAAATGKRLVGTVRAAATTAPADNKGGVAMAPSTFNLVKNIVGAGVLSLPAGVAVFSNSKTALVPACVLVATLGVFSAYCFVLIGRLCEMTNTKTYKAAVSSAIGNKAGKTLAVFTTLKTFSACLM